MNVAILTYHKSNNCGAVLQAWALEKIVEGFGHKVIFPSCISSCEKRWMPIPRRTNILKQIYHILHWVVESIFTIGWLDVVHYKFNKWRSNNLNQVFIAIEDLPKAVGLVIVGSDQVWNVDLAAADAPLFLGESLSPDLTKIGYAVSIGDKELSEDALARVESAINRFDAVSVRENLINTLLGTRFVETMDPTLLLTAKDYENVAGKRKVKSRYLFVYALVVTNALYDTARELARRLKVDLVVTSVYQRSKWNVPWGVKVGVSPDEFLAYIRDAEYVIASSFHGTVFSIIYHKKFISWRDQIDITESRPVALLKKLGLIDRLVTPRNSIDYIINILKHDAKEIIIPRKQSQEWLKNALLHK